MSRRAEIASAVDERRLVDTVIEAVSVSSPTGAEGEMGNLMARIMSELGMDVVVQEVEEGRPNVLGTLRGSGGGPSLMFNGHMDTSYSGQEPWLAGIPGFQPQGFEQDGYIYGLGVANMKGALSAFVEAIRALRDAGVTLRGDLLFSAVAGEIEKTPWGDEYRDARYRGYSTGARHLVTHGGVADMCILGEPTHQRVVLAHFGSMWARLSVGGAFIHTAWTRGREDENSILRMNKVLSRVEEWIPSWRADMSYGDTEGIVNVGAVRGGFPWRVSRTPDRTDLFLDLRVPPDRSMAEARGKFMELVRELDRQFTDFEVDGEIYLTAPGAVIEDTHELVTALAASHEEVDGTPPEREVVHWFSDAGTFTRYGVETVNYGTASGLPSPTMGENIEIKGLMDVTKVYALTAARICGENE